MERYLKHLLSVLFLGVLASCDDGLGLACDTALDLRVEPKEVVLQVGQSVEPEIELWRCGGRDRISMEVTWVSPDASVVRVSETGRLTGVAPGNALVEGVMATSPDLGPVFVSVEVVP